MLKEIFGLSSSEFDKSSTVIGCLDGNLSNMWSECYNCLQNYLENCFSSELKETFMLKWAEFVNYLKFGDFSKILEKAKNREVSLRNS